MSKFSAMMFFLLSVNANAGESMLKGPEIQLLLSDKILYGENNAYPIEQIFQKSGVTYYNSGGGQSQGSWHVKDDQFCSNWPPNPTWVCFNMVRDGDRIFFQGESDKRIEMHLTK
jgi:hypothetical protein